MDWIHHVISLSPLMRGALLNSRCSCCVSASARCEIHSLSHVGAGDGCCTGVRGSVVVVQFCWSVTRKKILPFGIVSVLV